MTTYKIIEAPPYDKGAPNTFWIRKETVKFFGLIKTCETIGDYKIDDEFGELGSMPFFSRKSAKKRLKIINYGKIQN